MTSYGYTDLHFKKEHETLFHKDCLATTPACRELNTAKWPQRESDTGAISQGLIEAANCVWLLMRRNELREMNLVENRKSSLDIPPAPIHGWGCHCAPTSLAGKIFWLGCNEKFSPLLSPETGWNLTAKYMRFNVTLYGNAVLFFLKLCHKHDQK